MKKNKTTIQRIWQHRRYTRWRKTKRQSRETGNIGGTQDEEKQNDNAEKLETCVPPMLPDSLDFRFVFLHLVYPLCCLWIVVLFFVFLCTSYVAGFSGLSFCFSSSCVPPMLPVSLDFRFLHRGYTRWGKTKRQSRGNIGGTQDEEKQNENPEKLAT
jgi:hypothetical protein